MRGIHLRGTIPLLAAGLVLAVAAGAGFALGAGRSPSANASDLVAARDVGTSADQADAGSASDLDAALIAAALAADPLGAADTAGLGKLRQGLGLLRGRAIVHVEAVVETRANGIQTFSLDHGTVGAVSSTSITLAEAGGRSATIALDSATRFRARGKSAVTAADVAPGAEVFVLSKKSGPGWLGLRVLLVPSQPTSASPAPSGS